MGECQIVEDELISFWTFDESDIVEKNNGTIMGDPEIVDCS